MSNACSSSTRRVRPLARAGLRRRVVSTRSRSSPTSSRSATRIPLPLPVRWCAARRLNDALTAGPLRRRIAGALGDGGPIVLWVADPRLVEPALRIPHDLFVFDAIDDWRHHSWAGIRCVARGYRRACHDADVVMAVNGHLLGILDPHGEGVVMPNAVDWDEWRDLSPTTPPCAAPPTPRSVRWEPCRSASMSACSRRSPVVFRSTTSSSSARSSTPTRCRRAAAERAAAGTAAARCAVPGLWRLWMPASFSTIATASSFDGPAQALRVPGGGTPVVSTVSSPNPRLAAWCGGADAATGSRPRSRGGRADDAARREARRAAVRGETWEVRAEQVATCSRRLTGEAESA